MRTPHPTLTPQELAIMKEVWRLDKATVRDVYEALRERRSIAYTTVMTMMKILEEKGYLKKSQSDRAYVYRPARPRQQVVGAMVRDFVDRVFDGAAGGLLLHLARDGKLTRAEREHINRLMSEEAEDEDDGARARKKAKGGE
jgi:predicted transcriptional regulator